MGFEAVLTVRLGRVKATVFSMSLMVTSEKYGKKRKTAFEQRIISTFTCRQQPAKAKTISVA
jgi:hypothetical protein